MSVGVELYIGWAIELDYDFIKKLDDDYWEKFHEFLYGFTYKNVKLVTDCYNGDYAYLIYPTDYLRNQDFYDGTKAVKDLQEVFKTPHEVRTELVEAYKKLTGEEVPGRLEIKLIRLVNNT